MADLISMKGRDGTRGKFCIIEWITTHEPTVCKDFACKLLIDELTVRRLHMKHKDNKEFVRAVFEKWLSRDDDDEDEVSQPCTWESLVQCAEDSGLDGTFIKLLRDNVLRRKCIRNLIVDHYTSALQHVAHASTAPCLRCRPYQEQQDFFTR